jgi:carbon-monoxide dehydrogenase medium subunit
MKPFEYFAPQTLSETVDILARFKGDARIIAGGTDLLLKMKAGKETPRAVVNIKRIPDLRGLTFNSRLAIAALTTLEELRRSPVVRDHFPALADAAATMASVQIRNLATVGGNLCNAAPSADLAPILIALNATAQIAGPGGARYVSLEEFFTGPGATVLAPDELLAAVEVPRPSGRALYLKHAPRAFMDIAVVGVGIAMGLDGERCKSVRIVLGAVAPRPLRARRAEHELLGQSPQPERIERAAKLAAAESEPIDDVRGSAWYRRLMVEVLTRRGLKELGTQSD